MSQMAWNSCRMLRMMSNGSSPSTLRMKPTRTDRSASRNMTASGRPPKKRVSAPGCWVASEIWGSWGGLCGGLMAGNLSRFLTCSCYAGHEHRFEGLQPIGLARRLVPAQPVDARKPHGEPRFVPARALQPFECHFKDQALVGLVHDLTHGAKAVDGVAANEP